MDALIKLLYKQSNLEILNLYLKCDVDITNVSIDKTGLKRIIIEGAPVITTKLYNDISEDVLKEDKKEDKFNMNSINFK